MKIRVYEKSNLFNVRSRVIVPLQLWWTDADGTEHLFKPVDNVYKDMDGLGLTLSINTSNSLYTVTDRAGYIHRVSLSAQGPYHTRTDGVRRRTRPGI